MIAKVEAGRQRIHQFDLFPCETQGNRDICSFASSVRACNLKTHRLPVEMQLGVLLRASALSLTCHSLTTLICGAKAATASSVESREGVWVLVLLANSLSVATRAAARVGRIRRPQVVSKLADFVFTKRIFFVFAFPSQKSIELVSTE